MDTHQLAEQIADDLFRSSFGGPVIRLRLEMEGGVSAGGICREVVIYRVEEILKQHVGAMLPLFMQV